MTAIAMTMRDILAAAAAGIAEHMGSKWKLCHIECLLEAGMTRIHVYDETDEEPDVWAFIPLEICHPSAIISAVLCGYRISTSPAAQKAVNDTFGDGEDDDEAAPVQEARRFHA
jgi:hypothetical protein